jgi:hypothetical protein
MKENLNKEALLALAEMSPRKKNDVKFDIKQ